MEKCLRKSLGKKLELNEPEDKEKRHIPGSKTTNHRSTKSLIITSNNSSSTKAKPPCPSQLTADSINPFKKIIHRHSSSQQFPISTQSLRLIKIPKTSNIEDKVSWKCLNLPVYPEKVLKNFKIHLTPFEEVEILTVEEIWFIGIGAQKIKTGVKNNGFDEDNGDYRIIIRDHLLYRYEILSTLGSGSFGTVVKVFDHKLMKEFAIKIAKNKPKFNQSAAEEYEILHFLNSKDSKNTFKVVNLLEKFYFRNHTCLKFELLGMSLYQYIKINSYKGFSSTIAKKIGKQILQCLCAIGSLEVIHCDLKPENILFQESNTLDLKVIDFGSATFTNKRYYNYIQSRFYRAPEILLGIDYSAKIDMWSFGCLMAELFTGRPIFVGENEAEQIQCIMEILGTPPKSLIERAPRRLHFFDQELNPLVIPNSKGRTRVCGSKSLKEVLSCCDSNSFDLISKCLQWEAGKRVSAAVAVQHPLFEERKVATASRHAKTQSQATFCFEKLIGRTERRAG